MKVPERHVPAAILGAGLTGLSAALTLSRRSLGYRLFEKQAEVGGHAVTVVDSGFRFDRTGHLLHLRSPSLKAEVEELLGYELLPIARRSRIFSHGVYTHYPFQANTFGLPPEVAYECLRGFFTRSSVPEAGEPRNFEEFCLTHFGEGISRHFMLPYNEKLWGVPASQISPDWCQRFVPLPTPDEVLQGALGLSRREFGYNARFSYPRRGIGELPRALARRLSGVQLSTAPVRIAADERRLMLPDGPLSYDLLLSSIPLPVLLDLFDRLPPEVADARKKLRATELFYLDIALSGPAGLDFHWTYVPEKRFPFYRVGCYSSFSPEMAPPGQANLYVELSERRPPDLSTLLPRVLSGLTEMGWIADPAEVLFVRPRHVAHAYVIYDRHHQAATRTIQGYLQSVGVISTGRYGGWNYSSMEDALLFGREAAEAALRQLR